MSYKPTQAQLMQDLLDGKKMRHLNWENDGYIQIFAGKAITEKGNSGIIYIQQADGKTEWEEYKEPCKRCNGSGRIKANEYIVPAPHISPTAVKSESEYKECPECSQKETCETCNHNKHKPDESDVDACIKCDDYDNWESKDQKKPNSIKVKLNKPKPLEIATEEETLKTCKTCKYADGDDFCSHAICVGYGSWEPKEPKKKAIDWEPLNARCYNNGERDSIMENRLRSCRNQEAIEKVINWINKHE